ncbi:MAG TPA: M1 family metallopeptidase [Fimbriimonadaceae bacterium]|nr:M1 family metallopeptidase [Fimbriimonadaceae bacterium]
MHRPLLVFALALAFGSAIALPKRPPRDYDLLNVEWHVTLDFDHAGLSGDVTNTVRPLQAGLTKVRFDFGPADISGVTVDGKPATYNRDGEGLFVDLGGPASVKAYSVEVKYTMHPTAGAYFIPASRGYPAHTPVAYTQGEMEDNRYWIPTYDFPDNKATADGYVTVPAGYKVLSNGRLVDDKKEGGTETWHWKQDLPMSTYLISFVAGPYDVGHDHWGRMDVSYWAPEGLLNWGQAAFGRTDRIIDFYSKITGFRYPWAKFAQAGVPDFMFGGMENTSAVTQTLSALFPPTDAPVANSTGLVAHELAHQWFGDTVTCADWSHAWLNEGFASFMPSFWVRKSDGEDAFERSRYGTFQGGLAAHRFQKRPVVYSDYELPIDNFGGFIYAGGASRLFMLMDKLGEPAFWKGVHDYLEEYKFKPVTTDIFFDAMSRSSGVDLKTFEKQWLYTAGVPNVSVELKDGKVELKQSGDLFDIQPWVWVLRDHKWTKKQVALESGSALVDMGDLKDAAVLLDPESRTMMNVTSHLTYTPEQALEIFKTGPIVARDRFVSRLGDQPQTVLRDLAKRERDLQLKETLIGMLNADSQDELVKYAHDSDARVRLAALRTLSRMHADGKDSATEALLNDAYSKDPNDDIRNFAFGVQVEKDSTGKLAEYGWGTDSFRESFRNAALSYWERHDKDKARAMALLALDKPLSEPLRVNSIQYLASIKDRPGEHEVYDHLVAVVQEGSFGATISAMNALVTYGNKDAAKYIEPLTHSSLHFMRRSAQGAMASLMGGGQAPAPRGRRGRQRDGNGG